MLYIRICSIIFTQFIFPFGVVYIAIQNSSSFARAYLLLFAFFHSLCVVQLFPIYFFLLFLANSYCMYVCVCVDVCSRIPATTELNTFCSPALECSYCCYLVVFCFSFSSYPSRYANYIHAPPSSHSLSYSHTHTHIVKLLDVD